MKKEKTIFLYFFLLHAIQYIRVLYRPAVLRTAFVQQILCASLPGGRSGYATSRKKPRDVA
jgi:hypothetical protein